MKTLVFIDSEIGYNDHKINDLGAVKEDGNVLHTTNIKEFSRFVSRSDFVCGHNIIDFDYKYLKNHIGTLFHTPKIIDTLPLSPILFPKKPYHNLVKDDKIRSDELNNPVSDAKKCKELFDSEVSQFNSLDDQLKRIYFSLLGNNIYFKEFFNYIGFSTTCNLTLTIKERFSGQICENVNLLDIINDSSVELAYSLASISAEDKESIVPLWVQKRYPKVDTVMTKLRGTKCADGCPYCEKKFNAKTRLNEYFGYDDFRLFNGQSLQEDAVNAAINKESILTIFPTGGGKSLTFQLPALIAGEASKSLTIVISPLQSLMKDQVDNLSNKGIIDAVTINGMISPVERQESINRVMSGVASLIYISPETLRSKTLERILLSRNIERIVIDEAHCFSSWGQDFRVDYLYIADFVKHLEEIKGNSKHIPISCFTATAKPKVISDIMDYFREKLGVNLKLFATSETRKNLAYHVIKVENDESRYQRLRDLIIQKNCPTIVYTSRTAKTIEIAEKLRNDGFTALPFNGKMDSKEKQENQESFMKNETQIIVATSAFGMGVDKDDVGLVVHYNISDSLENYVQESGRAGRNQSLSADCYILFNEEDLDSHFLLLNETKLSIDDIKQIWMAIKGLSKTRKIINCSALEIARQAGWDDSKHDIETRVRTAIAALENAGFVKRGQNSPRVFATALNTKTMIDASRIIEENAEVFENNEKLNSVRIIKYLIGANSRAKAQSDDAESRVDYLADVLGLDKMEVISCVDKLREIGVLTDDCDMHAYIKKSDTLNKTEISLAKTILLERYMIQKMLAGGKIKINIKEFIDNAIRENVKGATEKAIKTILYFWKLKGFISKNSSTLTKSYIIEPLEKQRSVVNKINKRNEIAFEIAKHLYDKASSNKNGDESYVGFSIKELLDAYNNSLLSQHKAKVEDIQDALLFMNKVGVLALDGGFTVLYNALQLERLADNKTRYTLENYKSLQEFYNLKVQQIHIVGEYANMMCRSIEEAQTFVYDYFNMDYDLFIKKYFRNRTNEIRKNITANKYNKLFGSLSEIQRNIVNDESQYITVIAGPGSGKTRVLVHKLASLLLLEDVKAEQLLMLTFSRAAATEFKQRLIDLIGPAANYVDIKTFHSYCFDVLGKIGNEEEFDDVVPTAIRMIRNDEVEMGKITKSVLVIDEAQDMDSNEFELVQELIAYNEDMRVIAVGDDDQNIYEFRGSNSKYMQQLMAQHQSRKYEMIDNYRSVNKIVSFSNMISRKIHTRLKEKPIVAVRKENGLLEIVKYESQYIENGIVQSIIDNQEKLGQIAVLTKTNDEALRVVGLLLKNGIKARLIQDNDVFVLYNLLEIRHILHLIDSDQESPVINDDQWENLLDIISKTYSNSNNLEVVQNLLSTFASINKVKYKTDLKEFINESKYEDFLNTNDCKVLVSTIHKSKGREFDTVYLLLNNYSMSTDEKVRDLYVGVTRAKTNLFVNYFGTTFDRFKNYQNFVYKHDKTKYLEPEELTINLSYVDVNLGYFKDDVVQQMVRTAISSESLDFNGFNLYLRSNARKRILCYSQKFKTDVLDCLIEKGFVLESAKIRHILIWKDKDDVDDREYRIVLPTLHFVKSKTEQIEKDVELDDCATDSVVPVCDNTSQEQNGETDKDKKSVKESSKRKSVFVSCSKEQAKFIKDFIEFITSNYSHIKYINLYGCPQFWLSSGAKKALFWFSFDDDKLYFKYRTQCIEKEKSQQICVEQDNTKQIFELAKKIAENNE